MLVCKVHASCCGEQLTFVSEVLNSPGNSAFQKKRSCPRVSGEMTRVAGAMVAVAAGVTVATASGSLAAVSAAATSARAAGSAPDGLHPEMIMLITNVTPRVI